MLHRLGSVLSSLQKSKTKHERKLPLLLLTASESIGISVPTFSYRLKRPLEAELVVVQDLPVPLLACPFAHNFDFTCCAQLLTETGVALRCFSLCPVDSWCFSVVVDEFEPGHAMIEKTMVTETKFIDLASIKEE